ncbi:MAG: DUF1848 domain-containing protein [Candidatus Latescibacterota bacterium]|nr:MAG: DUF1848 domain-containing protein [Candidatus Latescibacterota bacterium]
MIISASRRTDIPAFYSRWFMNRVRQGFCLVPNPFNTKQISRVTLAPGDVDALVFWSKDPEPMLEHLPELDRLGFAYYFLFTLNDYPDDLEPKVPGLSRRLATFKRLSKRLGPDRVIWRYDPIVISTATSHEYHRNRFASLTRELSGFTRRVIVSLVNYYRKTDRRLSRLEQAGITFERNVANLTETRRLLEFMSWTASHEGMEIQSCAEEEDYSAGGVKPGSCIDAELIHRLGRTVSPKKDPGQRDSCRCVISRDIGVPDTCLHGCRYCYATRNNELAQKRHAEHDPDSSVLWGPSMTL